MSSYARMELNAYLSLARRRHSVPSRSLLSHSFSLSPIRRHSFFPRFKFPRAPQRLVFIYFYIISEINKRRILFIFCFFFRTLWLLFMEPPSRVFEFKRETKAFNIYHRYGTANNSERVSHPVYSAATILFHAFYTPTAANENPIKTIFPLLLALLSF